MDEDEDDLARDADRQLLAKRHRHQHAFQYGLRRLSRAAAGRRRWKHQLPSARGHSSNLWLITLQTKAALSRRFVAIRLDECIKCIVSLGPYLVQSLRGGGNCSSGAGQIARQKWQEVESRNGAGHGLARRYGR